MHHWSPKAWKQNKSPSRWPRVLRDARLPLPAPLLCLEPASWGLNWAPSPQSGRPRVSFSLCPRAPWHVRCRWQQTCRTGHMLSHEGCYCYSVTKSHITRCNPWAAARQASLSFTVSQSLSKLMFIESMCHPTIFLCCPPSPFALDPPQLQGLFQWAGSSHQVAKVLELQLQYSVLPMNIQDWFPLGLTGLISSQSKGLLRVFSNTTVRKHEFLDTQPSLWFSSHNHTWLLEKTTALIMQIFVAKWCPCFLVCCLGLSELFFQGASIFYFHGCSHHLQWFWSPRK